MRTRQYPRRQMGGRRQQCARRRPIRAPNRSARLSGCVCLTACLFSHRRQNPHNAVMHLGHANGQARRHSAVTPPSLRCAALCAAPPKGRSAAPIRCIRCAGDDVDAQHDGARRQDVDAQRAGQPLDGVPRREYPRVPSRAFPSPPRDRCRAPPRSPSGMLRGACGTPGFHSIAA